MTATDVNETTEPAAETEGAFRESLLRNNRKIRDDRADAIIEAAEIHFRRKVEDLRLSITQAKRERENMLDLSPTHADSLVLAQDFKADEYVEKEIKIGVAIRNDEIKLEIATARYTHLFGGSL